MDGFVQRQSLAPDTLRLRAPASQDSKEVAPKQGKSKINSLDAVWGIKFKTNPKRKRTQDPQAEQQEQKSKENGSAYPNKKPRFQRYVPPEGQPPLRRLNFDNWRRPPVTANKLGDICFQLYDIDYYVSKHHIEWKDNQRGSADIRGEVPVLRLYGVTEEGHSICAHVHGFFPYFYVRVPDFLLSSPDADDQMYKALVQETKGSATSDVLSVDVVQRSNVYYFQPASVREATRFFRITLRIPALIYRYRELVSQIGLMFGKKRLTFMTYETNVLFTLRFLIDKQLSGCYWVLLPRQSYQLAVHSVQTRAQVELHIRYERMVVQPNSGKWIRLSARRTLAYDIECCGDDSHFPVAERNPVISIGVVIQLDDGTGNRKRIGLVFGLGTAAPLQSLPDPMPIKVFSFQDERALLVAFRDFLVAFDPDVLLGYNHINFDLPYLVKRALVLRIYFEFSNLGRLVNDYSWTKEKVLKTKAWGTQKDTETRVSGRIIRDPLTIIRRDLKFRSNSLNSVAIELLGLQKDDVHYSMIPKLFRGTDKDRARLWRYCLWDALLSLDIDERMTNEVNLASMARVSGVPQAMLLTRGQQVKGYSCLLRDIAQCNMAAPVLAKPDKKEKGDEDDDEEEEEDEDEKYEGATVLEPIKGYYPGMDEKGNPTQETEPIATLDFASLYPSIMMAYNLCYSTLLKDQAARDRLDPKQYITNPSGKHAFVKRDVCPGALPRVLSGFLKERKITKTAMEASTDEAEKAILNGRQLALKISANSVYGFTGAKKRGTLPCVPIAETVTEFGRYWIEDTKARVEAHFTRAKGYPGDAKVVYGDTDSVMISFGKGLDIPTVMKLGEEAANLVNDNLKKLGLEPMGVEFEKIYCPFLLVAKKHYAGLMWKPVSGKVKAELAKQGKTVEYKPEKKIDTKGMRNVRRDTCLLVKALLDETLRLVIREGKVQEALDGVCATIRQLLLGEIDVSQLVLSRGLRKDDYQAKTIQAEYWKKLRERDEAAAPRVGDRLSFVILQDVKDGKMCTRAEDPLYAIEHGCPIDFRYYLHNQLETPLTQIFTPLMRFIKHGSVRTVESIFTGDHTRGIVQHELRSGPLSAFIVKHGTCMGCQVTKLVCLQLFIPPFGDEQAELPSGYALCSNCESQRPALLIDVADKHREAEETAFRCWSQCRRCTDDRIHTLPNTNTTSTQQQEAIKRMMIGAPANCGASDCPIFYRRRTILQDVARLQVKLEALGKEDAPPPQSSLAEAPRSSSPTLMRKRKRHGSSRRRSRPSKSVLLRPTSKSPDVSQDKPSCPNVDAPMPAAECADTSLRGGQIVDMEDLVVDT